MAFNFMQSLIDNPTLESLDTANDNSDESDIDLDFEPLNHDFEELIESSESTDSVDLESGVSPSGCKWVSTPIPVEVNDFRVDLCQSLLQGTGKRKSTTAEVLSDPDSHKLTKLPGRHRVCYQCSQDKRKTGSVVPQRLFLGALHAMSASAKAIVLPNFTIFKQK